MDEEKAGKKVELVDRIGILVVSAGAMISGGVIIGVNLHYVLPEADPYIVAVGTGLIGIVMGVVILIRNL